MSLFTSIPVIETKHTRIRPMQIADASMMFEYMSDPEVCKHLTWFPHVHADDTVRYAAMATFSARNGGISEWIFEHKETSKVIGNGGFTAYDERHKSAEVFFILSRHYWNKGIMTEILTKLLEYGYKQGLHRVEAQCLTENKASHALLKKLGFTKEGVLRQKMLVKRKFRDVVIFSLLKNEFEIKKEEEYETDY